MNPIDEDIKRKEFKQVYVLYGTETFLKVTYKNRLVGALLPPDDTMNLTKYEGKISDSNELFEQAETMPFFADRRVILCEDSGLFNKADDDFADKLNNIPETAVMIFVESKADGRLKPLKTAKKIGAVVEMNAPSEDQLKRWIARRLDEDKKKMTNEAWQEFMLRSRPEVKDYKDKPADSMTKMNCEYEKLINYVGEKESIEISDVREICSGHLESKIFDLTDAMIANDEKKVMFLYHDMLMQKVSPLYILAMINRNFMNLLKIRELYDDRMDIKTIAKEVGVMDFVVKKNINLSQKFSIDRMKELLKDSAKAENDVKTGNLDANIAVELLMVKYSKKP